MIAASSQSIVTLYEVEGMSPEEIAFSEEYELTAIKATLLQFSSKYKEAIKANIEEGFTENEEKAARQVIAQLSQYAEDDNLRFRAAKYVRDDKLGRLDILKKTNGLNINLLMINGAFQKALERVDKAKQAIIDLTPNETKLLESARAKVV